MRNFHLTLFPFITENSEIFLVSWLKRRFTVPQWTFYGNFVRKKWKKFCIENFNLTLFPFIAEKRDFFSEIMAHRRFGQRQFSQFEIQTIQPKICIQFSLRQFSQFYKSLDSKEKIRIGAISRFKATRASPLRGVNRL